MVPVNWNDSQPYYPCHPRSIPAHGAAYEAADPVNLATGAHAYLAEADVVVYNPYGPSVVYQRNFHSGRAEAGYASPGLSVGWVDGYDAKLTILQPPQGRSWGDVRLTYPSGAEEAFVPAESNGQATGDFVEPPGAPYIVVGVPSATVNQWISITIMWKDRTKWLFTPIAASSHLLTGVTNRVGRSVLITRNPAADYRVSAVTDDTSPVPNTLLSFAYSGTDLSSITDVYGRKVTYSFNGGNLQSVSQITSQSEGNPPAQWTYGYQAYGGQPRLTSISSPSPTGSGTSTQAVSYGPWTFDETKWVVTSLVDANGNASEFTYEYNNGTRVQTKNADGIVEHEFIQNFDQAHGNRDTGCTDAKGYCTTLSYSTDPLRPAGVLDRDGKKTTFEYDQFGNATKMTTPRGVDTIYHYEYGDAAFPMGRLDWVQEGAKTRTDLTYYSETGLVHEITGPAPGGGTETTTYVYNALGDLTSKTTPGNNAASAIATALDYTTDGGYSQPAKAGQPLTITDNLGHVTHLRYDLRGNTISMKDALGNETNYSFNIADQLLTIMRPSTGQAP